VTSGSRVKNCTSVCLDVGRGTSERFDVIYFINLCVLTDPDLSGLRQAQLAILAAAKVVVEGHCVIMSSGIWWYMSRLCGWRPPGSHASNNCCRYRCAVSERVDCRVGLGWLLAVFRQVCMLTSQISS
jgi:hypothetical protein